MAKKKSASQLAAEAAYFAANNIYVEKKEKQKKLTVLSEGQDRTELPASELGLASVKAFGIYIAGINKVPKRIDMEDKKLVSLILEKYEDCLKYITKPENYYEPIKIMDYITLRCMTDGICYFSRHVIGVDTTNRDWVRKYQRNDELWYKVPKHCTTPKEMVGAISFRVEKLKEILKSFEDEA